MIFYLYNKNNSSSSVFNILHLFINYNLNFNFSIPSIIFFTSFSSFSNIFISVSNFSLYILFLFLLFPNSLFPSCLLQQAFLLCYLLLFLFYLFYFFPYPLVLVLIFLYLSLYHFLCFLIFLFLHQIPCFYELYENSYHLDFLTSNMFSSHQEFLLHHLFIFFVLWS